LVFRFAERSVAVARIVWDPLDKFLKEILLEHVVTAVQVLIRLPSRYSLMLSMPLASIAVAVTLWLPLLPNTAPAAGDVIFTPGSVVSSDPGVDVGTGVGVGELTGCEIGGFRGLTVMVRFWAPVMLNTVWSVATIWEVVGTKLT